jgi:molecular chaperone HscC
VIVGIDLGTTNSLVSAMTVSGPVVLASPEGAQLMPSAVAMDDDGTLLVGAPALERLTRDPDAGVRWFKRDMGSDRPLVLGDRTWTATELSAMVLRELKVRAELALGAPVDRAVITVPAYFREPQRAATMEAGALAGLEVARLVNEPTAAALAHGLLDSQTERTVAVLDLGGGTFDITLLEVFDGLIDVRATGGDARLGGEDFTDALLQHAVASLALADPDALGWRRAALRRECEEAKRRVTDGEVCHVPLPDLASPLWRTLRRLEVTPEVLAQAAEPLVRRLRVCILDTLHAGGLAADAVDEVLLVGGSSRLTALRDLAAEVFGRDPVAGTDPDLAVALGAAVQAGLVDDHAAVDDLMVTDVLGHSLGVEVAKSGVDRVHSGYYLPVLHRNTTLPVRRVERLSTMHPKQTRITIAVYQGEHRYVANNDKLGQFVVADIPEASEGGNQAVDVAFTHDVNGLLEVEATVVSTGEVATLVVERREGRLSEAARARAVAALARLKTHPRELLPNKLLLEAALARHARLDPGQRELLDGPLLAYESALERQQPEAITESADALRRALAHPALRP